MNATTGSGVRPAQMLKAFEESEYEVDVVSGYGAERKSKINEIKRKIRKGYKYDFIYSESLTMPTLLSERKHIPIHPFLDFSFFRFCKKQGIKIGLFYRDIYWKFPIYRSSTKKWVPYVSIPFFKYDLHKYKQLLDVLYVPSKKFMEYVNIEINWKILPSGGAYSIERNDTVINNDKNQINIFYVGGIVGNNDITGLIEVISQLQEVKLIVCCTEEEWNKNKLKFIPLSDNIVVVHARGEGLKEYYSQATVACMYYENSKYRDMALPVKLFEYIGYGKPIITNSKTAAAEYILENDIGWEVDYGSGELQKLLNRLAENPEEIEEKKQNVCKLAMVNTWKDRVSEVINDLTKDTV